MKLARFIDTKVKFSKPSKRKINVTVAVDVSAGMVGFDAEGCVDDVLGSLYLTGYRKARVLTFDFEVLLSYPVNLKRFQRPCYEHIFSAAGRGGTSIKSLIDREPEFLIVVSDMEFDYNPALAAKFPIVWVMVHNKPPPSTGHPFPYWKE